MPAPPTDRRGVRVGAVRYLNSRPLIEGLNGSLGPRGGLTLDHPGRLADGLRAGRFDAALVPSVAALSLSGAAILSDACVAARGPVRSVKVYFRVPPGAVRTLALDEGSRTSAALVRLLLAERFGVDPVREPLPVAAAAAPDVAAVSLAKTDADAVLLIGDRAMHDPSGQFDTVWDLGAEWHAWTGLPFVFAVWAARPGLDRRAAGRLGRLFSDCRDAGVRAVDRIAADAGSALGLSAADAAGYLRRNLHFTLGPAERAGLDLFAELCGRNGLLTEPSEPAAPAVVRPARPPRTRAAAPALLKVTG